MTRRHITTILTLVLVLVMSLAVSVSAESQKAEGHCYFNSEGTEIVSDFTSDDIVKLMSGLEPGDDFTFTVEFRNDYPGLTHWYMRNEVLKTLEQSYDRTQNGGYTYKLTHVKPNGEEQVLFDNSAVGGEYEMPVAPEDATTSHGTENTGEGLHQATNASDEFFFIQDLGQNDKPAYTKLYVKFDGETEVNDYMDTAGELLVAYAVELDNGDTTTITKKKVKTGDSTDLLTPVATMIGALLLLILTAISFRKDRRAARQGAGRKERD